MSQLLKRHSFQIRTQTNINEYDSLTGLPAEPVIETKDARGNIQPISGKEILQVDEGDRKRGVRNLFTKTEIKEDSTILFKDIEYEVRTVEDWDQGKLSHFKCRIVRIDVGLNQDTK